MIIAVDFDGTVVEHVYPEIGTEIPHCRRVLKALVVKGHHLILYTMRSGKELKEAVAFMKETIGVPLFGVNANPSQHEWTDSPKAYANYYIDDAAIGVPLFHPVDNNRRPYVNWNGVEKLLKQNNIL